MNEARTAKLLRHGSSQAVRLPKKFWLPGTEVRVRRFGRGVILEPVETDFESWLARLDAYLDEPLVADGRDQPEAPPAAPVFNDDIP